MKLLSGVRARIVLVAVVVAAPTLGLEFFQASESRDKAILRATDRVTELVRLAASEEDDSLQEASNLLRVLRLVPAVTKAISGECHALLREIINEHPRLMTLTAVATDGAVVCSSQAAVPPSLNLADRNWFQEVTQPDAPSTVISEMLVARSTGRPTVVVSTNFAGGSSAASVAGGNARPVALSATMDIAWFSEVAAKLPGLAGAGVLLVDVRSSSILARSTQSSQWVGKSFADHSMMALFHTQSEGSARVIGFDGVEQIIAFRRLPGDIRSHTVVVVGIPVALVLAEADAQLWSEMALTGLMLLAGVSMAWLLASYSIIRPLDALGRAAKRLGEGDASARAELPVLAVDELDRLATVFNLAMVKIADRDVLLGKLALQDALTGLANRRYFDATLAREWQQSLRTGRPVALVMVDVDHFKRYNDSYGHPAGDTCLRTVAAAIGDTVRQATDTAARYGGEEFAIIIPDTDVISAMRVAERLVRQITALAVPHVGASSGRLSISAGVAAFSPTDAHAGMASAQTLLDAADAALYRAKNAGRGRAVFHHGALAHTPRTLLPAA